MKKCLNKAVINLVIKDEQECPKKDPFGLCTVTDCLSCENCDYMIIMADDQTLNDYVKNDPNDKYLVQFFEPITCDVFEYLLDEYNDYRITRISDGVVLRYSNDDLILMGKEPRVRKIEDRIVNTVEKNLVKRIKRKFNQIKTSC